MACGTSLNCAIGDEKVRISSGSEGSSRDRRGRCRRC